MNYKKMYFKFMNEHYDISENCFHMLITLRDLWNKTEHLPYLGEAIHQYLVRLRKEYPAVYAVSIIDFPDFEPYVEAGYDAEGFMFLQPRPHGRFANQLYQKQIGRGT